MWYPKIIDTDKVLYMAIADAIETDILADILKPHDKMPPQRALAKIIGVNLTTISRAYKEAQKRGLIYGSVGNGTYVLQQELDKKEAFEDLKKEENLIDLGLVGSIYAEVIDPSQLLREVANESYVNRLMDYVPSQGLYRHREIAAKWMAQYGIEEDIEATVICSGAIHAINCCLLSCIEPGDRIAVDELTFAGFKNMAQLNGIQLEPIEMDSEGMIPEKLAQACEKQSIKGIYLMPNMQNPTATVMSDQRKEAIAERIRQYDLVLIEDDIYNFTNLKSRRALSELVPDNGIFICGMSKTFFPGLRIAFVKVPRRYLDKFVSAITSTVWMAPPLNAELVTRIIESKTAEEIIQRKRRVIAHRVQMAREILNDFEINTAQNSVYIWLKLPRGWSCSEFESMALIHGVRVISAHKFYVGTQSPPNAVRISLGAVRNEAQLVKGLTLIAQLLKRGPFISEPIM